jgi:hypothetical protein
LQLQGFSRVLTWFYSAYYFAVSWRFAVFIGEDGGKMAVGKNRKPRRFAPAKASHFETL